MGHHHQLQQPVTASKGQPLRGVVTVPGDKSISHRALMIAALASGTSTVHGLLEGEDVLCTAEALRRLGVSITQYSTGEWVIHGGGIGSLTEASTVLDMGNSGTSTRLLMGLVSSYPFTTFFTGDASLTKRPMGRAAKPLTHSGASFVSRNGGLLPLAVIGANPALPISYTLPVASAQVKSAILLAGLHTEGETEVIEPIPTRDHTERMLRYFGASIEISDAPEGGNRILLQGFPPLKAKDFTVPADPSSAAFLAVAACIIPDSEITITNIGINPLRIGVFTSLEEMGADLTWKNKRMVCGEEVADLTVRYRPLHAINVPKERAPSMIDEYPILAIAAATAKGITCFYGLEELKVKESNRLQAIASGLSGAGIKVKEGDDSLTIHGSKAAPLGGNVVATHMDHRIAMSFLILGMISKQPITVDDAQMIDTSFPGFITLMRSLGGIMTMGSSYDR